MYVRRTGTGDLTESISPPRRAIRTFVGFRQAHLALDLDISLSLFDFQGELLLRTCPENLDQQQSEK
jgi:hypothetical protein